MGRLAKACRALEERLSLAEAANDYWGQLSAAHYLGRLSASQGDFDAALRHFGRTLELAERLGARSRVGAETSNLSEVLFYLGDWERACGHAERAVAIARSESFGLKSPYFQYADVFRRLGMIHAATGHWDDALPLVEESVALAEGIPYPEAVRSGRAILAERDLLRGDPGAALARLEPLVARSDPEELGAVRLLPYLAWARLELGDADRAEEAALGGVALARTQDHNLALVDLLRVLGMTMSRRRRWGGAQRAFEEAVSVARAIGYRYAEARALYEWGLADAGGPKGRQARYRLEESARIFQVLGSLPYAELAQKALAERG
jgi:tetratricopeptide (TPR) repeat protein